MWWGYFLASMFRYGVTKSMRGGSSVTWSACIHSWIWIYLLRSLLGVGSGYRYCMGIWSLKKRGLFLVVEAGLGSKMEELDQDILRLRMCSFYFEGKYKIWINNLAHKIYIRINVYNLQINSEKSQQSNRSLNTTLIMLPPWKTMPNLRILNLLVLVCTPIHIK